jgi:hypothetical protein
VCTCSKDACTSEQTEVPTCAATVVKQPCHDGDETQVDSCGPGL